MPRFVSFFITLGIIAAVFYGAMFLVAKYMEPQERKMEHTIGRIKIQR